MLNILHTIFIYLIVLGILVVAHEWGHFIAARIFKIRVPDFSIGMGPLAFRLFKLGDTEYNVRWFPIGGFVRIAGMEPDDAPITYAAEKMAAARSGISVSDEELEKHPPMVAPTPPASEDPDTFFAHPAWQRALVIFAGPLMSFALGYLILFGIPIFAGQPTLTQINQVDTVNPGSEADKIGLKADDKIIGINGATVASGQVLVDTIHNSLGKTVTLIVERKGKDLTIVGVPQKIVDESTGKIYGALGFVPVIKEKFGVKTSIAGGFEYANGMTIGWFMSIGDLISHPSVKSFRQNAGGPIKMAQVESKAATEGSGILAQIVAMISMSLALFNLLPIPILDGGYLMLFFIEALRRGKKLTFQEQQNYMLTGLAVIGVLFIFIMYNDVTTPVPRLP
jgi:regulator of sigma E protease